MDILVIIFLVVVYVAAHATTFHSPAAAAFEEKQAAEAKRVARKAAKLETLTVEESIEEYAVVEVTLEELTVRLNADGHKIPAFVVEDALNNPTHSKHDSVQSTLNLMQMGC